MRFITPADLDFSKAALYRKTVRLHKDHVRRAEKEELIVTCHSSGKETENIARPGDYIVRMSNKDDGYVIEKERFFQVYEEHPEDPAFYRHIETRHMLIVIEDVHFTTPWGREMNVRAGGMIAVLRDALFGVDRFSFIRNFGRVASDEQQTVFCLMNEPLDVQLQKAQALNEKYHVDDIRLRMTHPEFFIRKEIL